MDMHIGTRIIVCSVNVVVGRGRTSYTKLHAYVVDKLMVIPKSNQWG